jgi:hypothetical protein
MEHHIQEYGILTTDSWRKWCDASFWSNESPFSDTSFRAGGVVFCKIDEVEKLFAVLRKSRRKIILVTGEGDLPCNAKLQNIIPLNVVHWFAHNVTGAHPKVTAMPIGLGSPRSHVTLKYHEILAAKNQKIKRDRMLYVNFRPNTNWEERKLAYEKFRDEAIFEDWVTFESPYDGITNERFLESLVRHMFVLCPPGNGVDTHRMWEALLAGAIPVVKRSPAMEPFRELPVLFVDDFREVTLDLLEKALEQINVPTRPHIMTTEPYWAERIRSKKGEIRGGGLMSWKEWITESAKYGAGMLARRLGIKGRVG